MSDRGRVEFFRHCLGDAEKARVLGVLDGTMLTTGRAVAEAEAGLAEYLGAAEVVCVSSCTAARAVRSANKASRPLPPMWTTTACRLDNIQQEQTIRPHIASGSPPTRAL